MEGISRREALRIIAVPPRLPSQGYFASSCQLPVSRRHLNFTARGARFFVVRF
jgi:hypothetical protein